MRRFVIVGLISLTAFSTRAQTTYYSRNATFGGNWNTANSWTLNSNGTGGPAAIPGRNDNVVILSGHTINITATNNNGSAGVAPDGLNLPNVGAFTESNIACFYQVGNITVNTGGTLNSAVKVMIGGVAQISGTMNVTLDVINVGKLYVSAGATFYTNDDLIITGTSKTVLDNTTRSDDDIYIDHTEARLCGSGVMNVGVNSNNTPIISYWNGATIAQICSGMTVTCGPGAGCSGFPQSGTGAFTLNLGNFNYYKALTIQSSQIPANQNNFPVLISFSSPDIRTTGNGGGVANANGFDIIFSSSNSCGTLSQLDHQLESYTSTAGTGTIVAWVRIPFLSASSNTTIYMYYGNASMTTNTSVTSVYDNNYKGVWHLHNNVLDATAYGNNGTNSGTANFANAKMGNGRTIGQNNYIQAPTTGLTTSGGTMSIWGRPTGFTATHYLFGHTTQPSYADRIQLYSDDVGGNLDLGLGDAHARNTNITTMALNNWAYYVLTWNGTNYVVYVNGTSAATAAYTGLATLQTFFDIGNDGNPGTRNEGWTGALDEMRMSSVVRSANWILTEFRSQNNPGTFFTVGAQVTSGCGPLPIGLLDFNAFPDKQRVIIQWSTSSEFNNDFFTIERSMDLTNWEAVTTLRGAGTSEQPLHYQTVDDGPYPGRSYYRLKQTDFDGSFEYSDPVVVLTTETVSLKVYPNPSTGNFTINGINATDLRQLAVYDLLGHEVQTTVIRSGDDYIIEGTSLHPGVYLLKVRGASYFVPVKLIKN